MSEEQERYSITLKGLVWLTLQDDELTNELMDSLELYMRRHHSKGGHPAVVFNMDENEFEFVTLRHSEDEPEG
jgi:hypothetical protein